jgi:hypothetical protein
MFWGSGSWENALKILLFNVGQPSERSLVACMPGTIGYAFNNYLFLAGIKQVFFQYCSSENLVIF